MASSTVHTFINSHRYLFNTSRYGTLFECVIKAKWKISKIVVLSKLPDPGWPWLTLLLNSLNRTKHCFAYIDTYITCFWKYKVQLRYLNSNWLLISQQRKDKKIPKKFEIFVYYKTLFTTFTNEVNADF